MTVIDLKISELFSGVKNGKYINEENEAAEIKALSNALNIAVVRKAAKNIKWQSSIIDDCHFMFETKPMRHFIKKFQKNQFS